MLSVHMQPGLPVYPVGSGCGSHSMMFDIDEAGHLQHEKMMASSQHIADKLKELASATNAYERQLEADVTYFKAQARSEIGEVDIVDLACALASVGHDVKVRNALGGGTSNYFRNLSHEFLLVKGDRGCLGAELVVECNFQEHFRIPCATATYSSLLRSVPEVFVGTLAKMAPIVETLVREMCTCFALQQVTVPPWRSARSIMSKWAPQKAADWSPDASPRTSRGASPKQRSVLHSPDTLAAKATAAAASPDLPDGDMLVPMALGGQCSAAPPRGASEGHSVHIGFGADSTVTRWESCSPKSDPMLPFA